MPAEIPSPPRGELVDLRLYDDSQGDSSEEKVVSYLDSLKGTKVMVKRIQDHHYWDLVLLAIGAYSPLEGYLSKRDYNCVLQECRLESGALWAIPISLPFDDEEANAVASERVGAVALVASGEPAGNVAYSEQQWWSPELGKPLAIIELQDVFEVDLATEARAVFKTDDERHPGVARLFEDGRYRAAGRVKVLEKIDPPYPGYAFTPQETRRAFIEAGWKKVVAFQTRNPIHRAHEYLCKCALEITDGLLIHPVVGTTKDDDIPADVRMSCYEALVEHYFPKDRVMIASFPAPMRYAGPREALHHALVRRNYGASHFIIGRDHAGVGNYYGTYEAQEFVSSFDISELGIVPLFFEHAFYCVKCDQMATAKTCGHSESERRHLSGTRVREYLRQGRSLPESFTRPEVAELLRRHAVQHSQA
ncbi:MAG: sulfate adenylyltransferase [Acidimicrobiia bacterium]